MESLKSYLEKEVAYYELQCVRATSDVKEARDDYGRSSEEYHEAHSERGYLNRARQRVFQQLQDLS